MGPLFNIVYWFLGVVFLIIAALAAAAVGGIGFALTFYIARDRTHKSKALSTAVAVLAGGLVGPVIFCGLCAWSLNGPTGPRSKPTQSDIVGVWQASAGSLEAMRRGHYITSTHTLSFREDGTFEMVNMPDWWLQFGKSSGGFISGAGTWTIVEDQDQWKLQIRFTYLSAEPGGLVTYFYISGEKPPYRIYDYIGDADAGQTIVFEKP